MVSARPRSEEGVCREGSAIEVCGKAGGKPWGKALEEKPGAGNCQGSSEIRPEIGGEGLRKDSAGVTASLGLEAKRGSGIRQECVLAPNLKKVEILCHFGRGSEEGQRWGDG